VARNLVAKLLNVLHSADPRKVCHGLRFITLTLKTSDAPLPAQLDRLYDSFHRLRRLSLWKKTVTGGILFVELTVTKTGQWHPHLHILTSGKFLPQAALSNAWRNITGDSWIVDVRLIRNPAIAAGYVTKYAGKLVPAGLVHDRARLVEAVIGLAGRHSFSPIGGWTHWHLSDSPPDDTSWEPVAPLWLILRLAQDGDVDARRIVLSLRKEPTREQPDTDSRAPPALPTLRTPDLTGLCSAEPNGGTSASVPPGGFRVSGGD
jgi:hypothetical protein